MTQLSPAGAQLVEELSSRYGITTDAVTHMLLAVHHGNGSMAQFNHQEFGGSGQWMQGGMTMVSDLFNHQLKSLVDNLCNDLSNALASHQTTPFRGSFQSQSQSGLNSQAQGAGQIAGRNSLFVPDPQNEWWPKHLGMPSAIGSQNNVRYAYFANDRRLAVSTGGPAWVYDTLDHQIGGFGQQQGGGASITFTSQFGTVDLSSLPVVWRDGVAVQEQPLRASPDAATGNIPGLQDAQMGTAREPVHLQSVQPVGNAHVDEKPEEVIALLEKLGQLKEKGYITEEEFQAKKSDLLNRI